MLGFNSTVLCGPAERWIILLSPPSKVCRTSPASLSTSPPPLGESCTLFLAEVNSTLELLLPLLGVSCALGELLLLASDRCLPPGEKDL